MYNIREIRDGNWDASSMSDYDERKTVYGQLRELIHYFNSNDHELVSVVPMKDGSLVVISKAVELGIRRG